LSVDIPVSGISLHIVVHYCSSSSVCNVIQNKNFQNFSCTVANTSTGEFA